MVERWIYWFEEIGQEHSDLVGKKCANLGEMTKMGLPVPRGFSLSAKTPAKGVRRKIGICPVNPTSPNRNAEWVRRYTNQPIAILCIQVPIKEMP